MKQKEIHIGSFFVTATVGEDGRLKILIASSDGSALLENGISTGRKDNITNLFSTENVESYLLNKRNF